jgi:hypothetical protein
MENLMKRKLAGVIGAMVFVIAGPAVAHHSFAMFDMTKTVTIAGTVKDFQWTNPHSWIDIVVPNESGGAETWAIECGGGAGLSRAGWTRKSLSPGDRISMEIHPLRSGEKGGSMASVTLPDGHKLAF